MAARRARRYKAEEVTSILLDIPEDSDISDFEGEERDHRSGMDESNTDNMQIFHLPNWAIVIATFREMKQQFSPEDN